MIHWMAYHNNDLWRKVYAYLDEHDTPDHRLSEVIMSTGLDYDLQSYTAAGSIFLGLVYYPTIRLIFMADGLPMEQWFW